MDAATGRGELKGIADRFLLALTVWREARGEPYPVKVGVACSILNRVQRPSWWGSDVMSVVTKRWQYSSMTDPHDPQLATWPQPSDASWWDCLQIACAALDGRLMHPAPGADSYYDVSIAAPQWADPARFVAQLGKIRFYDLDRDHEREAAA